MRRRRCSSTPSRVLIKRSSKSRVRRSRMRRWRISSPISKLYTNMRRRKVASVTSADVMGPMMMVSHVSPTRSSEAAIRRTVAAATTTIMAAIGMETAAAIMMVRSGTMTVHSILMGVINGVSVG